MKKFSWRTIQHQFLKFFGQFYLIIAVLSVSVILLIGVTRYVWPLFQQIRTEGTVDLTKIEMRESRLREYLGNLKFLKQRYDSFSKQQIKKLNDILPTSADIPSLFVEIQDLAGRNHMILGSIDIAETNSGIVDEEEAEEKQVDEDETGNEPLESIAGVRELDLVLIVSGGNYQDLKNFLSEIEHHLRLFDVTSINFGSVEGGPYTINMKTYYVP